VVYLRYKLLPYNYTLAYKQASKGEPLVAPLYYYYPADTAAVNVQDEFMWGENILVAPVLKKGAVERKVYLPGGRNWYALTFDGSLETDSGSLPKKAPINKQLVFVKAGSFIPVLYNDHVSSTTGFSKDSIEVHYYFDKASSEYILFDDDGISRNSIAQKKMQLITFKKEDENGRAKITVSLDNNLSTEHLKKYIRLVLHNNEGNNMNVWINGKETVFDIPSYTNALKMQKELSFTLSKKPVIIEIQSHQ
jgi:alpha-glucosidase (family GH31 glycosyl hydrolase)